jgi:hypothetical protein
MESPSSGQSRGALSAILFGVFVLAGTAQGQVVSRSKEIVVVKPASLPTLAQEPGIALQLYTEAGNGSAYLYIEQSQGQRLLVLDVTDPGNVKMVGDVTLDVPGPFDFVGTSGRSSLLISFRHNSGMAVLDLRTAKAPRLKAVPNVQTPGHSEPLGSSTFLIEDRHTLDAPEIARDYRVVDFSKPAEPFILYTAKQVIATLSRDETGTKFLLGRDGLTIVRRPQVEAEYRSEQSFSN